MIRSGAPRLEVFAVEDTSVQLVWRGLRPGPLRLDVPGTGVGCEQVVAGGPGSVVLDGLPAGRDLEVRGTGPALGGSAARLPFRTLDPLRGEPLTRVATISDLHLGTEAFGHRGTIHEHPAPAVPHPLRCTTCAMADAVAWGADRIVAKGDLTHRGDVDEWRTWAGLVEAAPVPVDAVAGNHDRGGHHERRPGPRTPPLLPEEAAGVYGFALASPMLVRDHPGLRVVLLDSTVQGRNRGTLAHLLEDLGDAVADADPDGSVLVALHHHLHARPVTEGWPVGVAHPESRSVLERLGAAHPRVLVTSGHTHRHRRWDHGGVTSTQVGSTKDYPGVWAGYVAHEGGLRQVVRRVSRPDCLAWTDRTRRAALGAWRWVAPGRLDARCFNHPASVVRSGR